MRAQAIPFEASWPDAARLSDRRLIDVFDRYAGVGRGRRVLEVGRARSGWQDFLASERGCDVSGLPLDADPGAVEPFDLVFSMGILDRLERPVQHLVALLPLVRPGGRVLTTVPNLRAWNGWVQRLGSPGALEGHAFYDPASLGALHDIAGFRPVTAGHVGFFDGYLSSTDESVTDSRRRLHRRVCAITGRAAAFWVLLTGGALAPETPFLSPHLYVVALRPARSAR